MKGLIKSIVLAEGADVCGMVDRICITSAKKIEREWSCLAVRKNGKGE